MIFIIIFYSTSSRTKIHIYNITSLFRLKLSINYVYIKVRFLKLHYSRNKKILQILVKINFYYMIISFNSSRVSHVMRSCIIFSSIKNVISHLKDGISLTYLSTLFCFCISIVYLIILLTSMWKHSIYFP